MKLVVRNISQSFGETKALSNVSFELPQGKIFGFVGPNGAGKTTLLRILSGIDVPDKGDAFWNDKSLIEYPDFLRREVGYMPDLLPSIPDITVLNYLDFYASAFGYRGKSKDKIIADAILFAELEGIENNFIGNLSKGQKQLVSLGRIFIHNPNFIILDEPAAGLDPQNRLKLTQKLKQWNQQGKTIFISSHILSELEDIVDGVVIIDKGRIIKAGFLADSAKENKEVDVNNKAKSFENVMISLDYFEDKPFIVVNADNILIDDGYKPIIRQMQDVWNDDEHDVVLLLRNIEGILGDKPKYGDYRIEGKTIVRNRNKQAIGGYDFVYVGVSIIHPRVFKGCDKEKFSLVEVFDKAEKNGRLGYALSDRAEFLVGTPEAVEEAEALLNKKINP